MKKVYLLFALLASLMLINVVHAENIYNKLLETELTDYYYPAGHYPYKDGYIIVDYDDDEEKAILKYYSNTGELLKTKEYDDLYIYAIDGDDIYAYYYDENEDEDYLVRLNSNFEIVKQTEYPYTDYVSSDNLPEFYRIFRRYLYVYMKVKDNKLYIVDENANVQRFTKDLVFEDKHQITKSEMEELFPEYKPLLRLHETSQENVGYIGYDYKDGKVITSKLTMNNTCIQETIANNNGTMNEELEREIIKNCIKKELVLYDSNLKPIWETELNENKMISEIKFANNYVITIEGEMFSQDSSSNIVVYDMKGNKVQTISSELTYSEIVATPYGFIITEANRGEGNMLVYGTLGETFSGDPSPSDPNIPNVPVDDDIIDNRSGIDIIKDILKANELEDASNQDKKIGGIILGEAPGVISSRHQVYYAMLNVETKVTSGKGTIEVVKSSKVGEPVTFTIKPEKGFVLGEVKVTDADGNVVVFTENTFTMPSADVVIEVVFKPVNPETKDIAITTIVLITIVTGGLYLIYRKKMKEIN